MFFYKNQNVQILLYFDSTLKIIQHHPPQILSSFLAKIIISSSFYEK